MKNQKNSHLTTVTGHMMGLKKEMMDTWDLPTQIMLIRYLWHTFIKFILSNFQKLFVPHAVASHWLFKLGREAGGGGGVRGEHSNRKSLPVRGGGTLRVVVAHLSVRLSLPLHPFAFFACSPSFAVAIVIIIIWSTSTSLSATFFSISSSLSSSCSCCVHGQDT